MNTIEVDHIPAECRVFVEYDYARTFAVAMEIDDIYHFKKGWVEYWCVKEDKPEEND